MCLGGLPFGRRRLDVYVHDRGDGHDDDDDGGGGHHDDAHGSVQYALNVHRHSIGVA